MNGRHISILSHYPRCAVLLSMACIQCSLGNVSGRDEVIWWLSVVPEYSCIDVSTSSATVDRVLSLQGSPFCLEMLPCIYWTWKAQGGFTRTDGRGAATSAPSQHNWGALLTPFLSVIGCMHECSELCTSVSVHVEGKGEHFRFLRSLPLLFLRLAPSLAWNLLSRLDFLVSNWGAPLVFAFPTLGLHLHHTYPCSSF